MSITSLSLSRKEEEAIHLGDKITVYVDKIGKHKVQLTIEAPAEIKILRSELLGHED
ncbi:carbon storage regulator [bacterium]|nr:carbon storage regulator [bacterium]